MMGGRKEQGGWRVYAFVEREMGASTVASKCVAIQKVAPTLQCGKSEEQWALEQWCSSVPPSAKDGYADYV